MMLHDMDTDLQCNGNEMLPAPLAHEQFSKGRFKNVTEGVNFKL